MVVIPGERELKLHEQNAFGFTDMIWNMRFHNDNGKESFKLGDSDVIVQIDYPYEYDESIQLIKFDEECIQLHKAIGNALQTMEDEKFKSFFESIDEQFKQIDDREE